MTTATGLKAKTWKCGSCERTVDVSHIGQEADYPVPHEDGWAEVQVRVYTEDEPVKRYYAHVCPDHVPDETWKP